jgi:hypothetical protein
MKRTSACLVALVLTFAGVSAARAQYASPPPDAAPSLLPPLGAGDQPAPVDGPVVAPLPRLSDYIVGTRGDCCGPLGDGPINTEVYLRWGVSLPTNAGFFGKTLTTGWVVQVGGRSLFFNPTADAAWTIDVSISNVSNHGQRSDQMAVLRNLSVPQPTPDPLTGQTLDVTVPALPVTVSGLNRTYVNLGAGREWYLIGTGHKPCDGDCGGGRMWRAGFDVGGRWGTAKLELHEIRHRTDVIGAVYLALHSDVEFPCGGFLFILGGRVEWDYTWTDILQTTDADLQNVNLLMALGVRF